MESWNLFREFLLGVGSKQKCCFFLNPFLTQPVAKLQTFWDYIFSRENKVQTFFFRVHWLSEFYCLNLVNHHEKSSLEGNMIFTQTNQFYQI